MNDQEFNCLVDAAPEDKMQFVEQVTDALMERIRASGHMESVLHGLVMLAVNQVAIESYTEELLSEEREEIFEDLSSDFAGYLGIDVDLVFFPGGTH